jgi:hypothetical protein
MLRPICRHTWYIATNCGEQTMVVYGGLTISETEFCTSSQIFKKDPIMYIKIKQISVFLPP